MEILVKFKLGPISPLYVSSLFPLEVQKKSIGSESPLMFNQL